MPSHSPLDVLLQAAEGPKVSIYFPTHRSGPETVTDASKLAKALDEAKEKLAGGAEPLMSRNRADRMLAHARAAVEQDSFWQHQADGLACFIAKGEGQGEDGDGNGGDGADRTRFVRLDGPTPTVTVVADTFHLRPLLLAAARDGAFHLLTITRDNVSLFQGNADGLTEIEPDGMITGIEDVTWKTDYEASTGFHPDGQGGGMPGDGFDAGRGGGGADGAPRYHALGTSPEDYDDVEFEKFLQGVAKAVEGELAGTGSPLIVIADPRTVGWFKKALDYPHLVGDVQKNPQDYDLKGLHDAAWELVRPHLNKDRDEGLERLEGRLASGDEPATNEIGTLVRAAVEGRVDTLFLARHADGEARLWGTYDPQTREIAPADGPKEGAQDLVNLAAVETMRNGGNVEVMPEGKVQALGEAAAILRY